MGSGCLIPRADPSIAEEIKKTLLELEQDSSLIPNNTSKSTK